MTLINVDLPLEIWSDILGYLPVKSLLTTCMLNRLLLDLSLDVLYRDIYLNSTDLRVFERLIPDQQISKCVRRICIFSHRALQDLFTFGQLSRHQPVFQDKFNPTLIRLEGLRRQKHEYNVYSPPLLPCVRELSIFSDGDPETPIFMMDLWRRYCLGEGLRKIEFAAGSNDLFIAPITKLPTLLSVSTIMPRLTNLSIHFMDENYFSPDIVSRFILRALNDTPNLVSLSLSYSPNCTPDTRIPTVFNWRNSGQLRFSEVLQNLQVSLPALKEINLQVPFTPMTMSNPGALTEWLRMYQGQLERLSIRAVSLYDSGLDSSSDSDSESTTTAHSVHYDPGVVYFTWLGGVDEWSHNGFPSLKFSNLRSLEIRTQKTELFMPPLNVVTPSLRSLKIGQEDILDQADVETLVQSLSTSRGLETLSLRCDRPRPSLFDIIRMNLPRLKVLEVNCRRPMTQAGFKNLVKRRYSWKLSRLRITTATQIASVGKHFHPDLKAMQAVAACLYVSPFLDTELTCGCTTL